MTTTLQNLILGAEFRAGLAAAVAAAVRQADATGLPPAYISHQGNALVTHFEQPDREISP